MHLAIGTAGHIDHGKSTLVAALTGGRTDRLPEEKRRGITIELGFASWNVAPDVTASVIDVPGHEGLVHTMVAGAWGLDLVLLVVAADEGVMPQTREHLAIASLLGVRGAVVALTKADRVDQDLLGLAAEEVRAQVARAGFANAPVIPVSALSGQGLPELTGAVLDVARALPRRPADGIAFLPVDRVFTVKGFGTVVTGTLSGGSLKVDDVVDLHPGPKGLRVRSLQSHGKSVPVAHPSWRTAVNLPGIEVKDVERGAVLAPSSALVPTQRVDVRVTLLPEAPRLRDHAATTLHIGATSVPARVRCVYAAEDESPSVESGEERIVQLILERPVVCRPSQRFILRSHRRLPGQGATVGGGEILDPHPPRRRRGRPETQQALLALTEGTLQQRLIQAVHDEGIRGASVSLLSRRMSAPDVKKTLEDTIGRGHLKRARLSDGDVLWHPDRLESFNERLVTALTAHHKAHPQDAAAPLETLRTSLKVDGEVLERARFLALLKVLKNAEIVVEEDTARLAQHRPRGVSAQLLHQVEQVHVQAGVAPPTRKELLATTGASAEQVGDALRTLVSSGALIRVKEDLHFARAPYDVLVARTLALIDEKNGITTQEFKDLMGESRKYVIPFLEHLDDTRITLRVGEKRLRRIAR